MSIKAPEGYIASFIGSGKVTHCIQEGADKTLCGKAATQITARPGTGIACKACAKVVEALTNTIPGTATETADQETPDTPAARNVQVTEQVNTFIEKVRTARQDGDKEGVKAAVNEADRLMAALPPAMRGMLRGALMEARQTPMADNATADTENAPADEQPQADTPENAESAAAVDRPQITAGGEDSEGADDDQAPDANQSGEADQGANAMANLIIMGAKLVTTAVRTRVTGNKAIAQVLLDMRTRITDKDGDIDLRSATDEAKQNSTRMYQLVTDAIEKTPDHADHLLSEVESIKRGVQTAMRDEVVLYVRSLDASPEEFAKFERAREEFPELSPSEAVWAYYEKVGKALPRQTRAELARAKRALAQEAKAKVNPKEDNKPSAPAEDVTDETEDKEEEVTQYEKDVEAIKKATAALMAIAKRAAETDSDERNGLKIRLEALLTDVSQEVAPL